ncbi:hypothetical protein C1H46_035178 [Malus baccata]|uniref:Uncharacterized protein n=1 Tax=Malus baccata TaxID=106549 RepID=A0A540KYI7_MALBA|nr:hypothetical protein C1H46_035178 [Malus baccata]
MTLNHSISVILDFKETTIHREFHRQSKSIMYRRYFRPPRCSNNGNFGIKRQSTAYSTARDPKMATTVELLPVLMCFEAVESIDVGHPKLQHIVTQDENGNPLRIPSTVYDHSIPPLLSSSPMLRALATLAVTPYSNNSAAFTVLLPELKTMTSTPQLLHKHSFSDTTKTEPEVVLNLSIISANSEAKFLSLLHDNYSAYLQDKFGWVSWYLVGTFMRKDFCAWKLFAEIPDSSCYVVLNRDICYCNGIQDKGGRSQFRKMQLKMAMAQIKLLRNKRQAVVKQLRRDIALLPQSGQEATARI